MLSTTLVKNPAVSAAEDKELKREAMRNGGVAFTPKLGTWLQHYRAPTTSVESRTHDSHQRKRAELVARVVARKARVDALIELRVRALKDSTRHWPRPRCHVHDKENLRHTEVKMRANQLRQAEKEVAARAAADIRVVTLM
ncbi:hypothetical protein B0H11DRAFT_2233310 [Mycena galericulata]|nr:hypothetical protein B0H11DRAFT_2233260 [Mycena galericulata]KAJ7480534.1 hypothetical protein B0H11DRAFT_2233310 [Mycena galericulata]